MLRPPWDSTDLLAAAGLSKLETLSLIAVLFFMPLQIYADGTVPLVLLAALGTLALIGAVLGQPWRPGDRSAIVATSRSLALAGLSLVLVVVADFHLATLFAPQFAFPLIVATVAAVAVWYVVFRTPTHGPHRWVATVLMLVAVVTTGYAYLVGIAEPNIDVFALHRSAADALAQWRNPYVEAQAVITHLLVPAGTIVEGYTYPPLSLFAYSVSEWLTGDPRWTSVVAVGAVVLIIASPWAAWTRPLATVRLSLALLLVTPPGFGIVAFFAWTEPISLLFLAVAARFWRSKPLISAIALGLALATKQYFVLALPLLLFWPDDWRWKRLGVVFGVVFATMLPFLLIDANALLDAMLGNTAFSALPRPDSTNLVYFGFIIPRWVAIGAAAALGVWLGRRGGHGFRFTLALAAVLAVAFFLGVAAFRNYWFVITGMVLISLSERYLVDEDLTVPDEAAVAA